MTELSPSGRFAERSASPTISDVARLAQAGKTSVSRYLNGEMEALSPDLKNRIEAAIAELAYRPNQMARGLKRGRTRLIGVVVADLQNPYTVSVMQGIEAACQQFGLMPMVCNAANEIALESRYLDLLRTYRAEGLIVNPVGLPEQTLDTMASGSVPMVFLDRTIDGVHCDSVCLDNKTASHTIVDHFADNGFQHLFFITEPYLSVSSRREREAGFTASAARRHLQAETLVVDLSDPGSVHAALDRVSACASRTRTALLAANGQTMLSLAVAMTTQPVPGLGIASFDDPEWVALAAPGVTTLRQPTYDIGHTAVAFLNERIDGLQSAPRIHTFDATLIARRSTVAVAR